MARNDIGWVQARHIAVALLGVCLVAGTAAAQEGGTDEQTASEVGDTLTLDGNTQSLTPASATTSSRPGSTSRLGSTAS